MVKPRLGMNGNGCAGSIASGVSSGNTCVRKWSSSQVRSSFLRSLRRRPARCRRLPAPDAARASAPAGRWRAAKPLRRCARVARRASARPGSGSVMPSRTWPLRPATRTMKNSSRLLAEIDRKRTRSSSGWLCVGGLFQHAAIEMQPGQFAIDEAFRGCPQAFGRQRCRDRFGSTAGDFLNQNNSLRAICHLKMPRKTKH